MTDLSTRFGQAMAELPDPGEAAAVAVSGGPDSMALALLLRDLFRGQGRQLTALVVDHGLRSGSGAEARLVADRLAHASIPGIILRWGDARSGTALQARARDARYRLMLDWCRANGVRSLFVGHHADDQAATVAMRIARGSGLDGLGAMRPATWREGIGIFRPLLQVTKQDLLAWLSAQGVAWVEDPTNDDPRHERNRIDGELAAHPQSLQHRQRLNRLARRAARATDALQLWTDRAWQEMAVTGIAGDVTLDLDGFRALPEEIRLRLLLRAVEQAGGTAAGLEKAENALERLQHGATVTALTLGHALVRQSGGRLRVERERRNLPCLDWQPDAPRSLLWDGRFRLDLSAPLAVPVMIGPGRSDSALLPVVYRDGNPLGCPVRQPVMLPGDVAVHATALFTSPG